MIRGFHVIATSAAVGQARDVEDVTFVAFDGIQPLDLVGPHEAFSAANRLLVADGKNSAYRLRVAAVRDQAVSTSGLRLATDPLPARHLDTLVVPGGEGARDLAGSGLEEWLPAARPRRLLTVCTGAMLAADAGLLDGHRVTTHWASSSELAGRHPQVTVDPKPVWIRDGEVWSSGGVTAGIDLALAVIAADHGARLAHEVARWLVMFMRRPGNQSQFAAPVWLERARDDRIRRVQTLVEADPSSEHRIEAIAARESLSTRHFQRLFAEQTGMPFGTYLMELRVTTAQRALVQSDLPVATIARMSGFGSDESLRRTFVDRLGVTPTAYRHHFTQGAS